MKILHKNNDLDFFCKLKKSELNNEEKGKRFGIDKLAGFFNLKSEILEIIRWPLRYEHLFKNLHIKPLSGVLLYGPPGCGKTALATAISEETKNEVKWIFVKGPELLGKYIGSSEAAVRDLFARARASKPCIIFFDEFDAIAPRRGADSTGVTDRVVNMLLTELDGCADRSNVFIIAASNRPEMIDPALLRPGRIDRHIVVPWPDSEERANILSKFLEGNTAEKEMIDFEYLVNNTEGFSVSDMKALVYNATLKRIASISTSTSRYHEKSSNSVSYMLEPGDIWKKSESSQDSGNSHYENTQNNTSCSLDSPLNEMNLRMEDLKMALKETFPALNSYSKREVDQRLASFGNPSLFKLTPDEKVTLM